MTKEFYLIVEAKRSRYYSRDGAVTDFGLRLVKEKPKLSNDEIAVKLKMTVPAEFFERMIPVVTVDVPKDAIFTMNQEAVVSLVAETLSQKLKVSLEDAEDGLKQMLTKKEEIS